ncbi:hypothetical protein BDW74DRAFT_144762 [Aspergillus multicolor]|uniref:uncharacterized protein n=1 Tax=Aspergillus multicolor TaxID=41759 RepID=UPI003CCCF114
MPSEPLSPALTTIINKLSSLIAQGDVLKATVEGGWRYHGDAFQRETETLKDAIARAGNKVVRCHATHFTRGAIIQNPTRRLVLIQIRGTSRLAGPGESLQPGSYRYLDESPTLIAEGEGGIDVGIVVLAADTAFREI